MVTKIEWTDEVWNPVTGCSKVSQGCKHCYAERMAKQLAGRAGYPAAPNQFDVTLHPERLDIPLGWKRPRRIFVNSMSDLFHPDVPREFIECIFKVISNRDWFYAGTKPHIYQVLTKRPERMMNEISNYFGIKPPQNLWLGVSVEDQPTADERIFWLLKTPVAKRFVSYEPALGPVDLNKHECLCETWVKGGLTIGTYLDWVIAGGESGPEARPAHPDWFRSVRDQCVEAGTPFFFKQWGEWMQTGLFNPEKIGWKHRPAYGDFIGTDREGAFWDGVKMTRIGKKQAGRLLDGREWNEFPNGDSYVSSN